MEDVKRWHLSDDGEIRPCFASVGACPFEGNPHFGSIQEAEDYRFKQFALQIEDNEFVSKKSMLMNYVVFSEDHFITKEEIVTGLEKVFNIKKEILLTDFAKLHESPIDEYYENWIKSVDQYPDVSTKEELNEWISSLEGPVEELTFKSQRAIFNFQEIHKKDLREKILNSPYFDYSQHYGFGTIDGLVPPLEKHVYMLNSHIQNNPHLQDTTPIQKVEDDSEAIDILLAFDREYKRKLSYHKKDYNEGLKNGNSAEEMIKLEEDWVSTKKRAVNQLVESLYEYYYVPKSGTTQEPKVILSNAASGVWLIKSTKTKRK